VLLPGRRKHLNLHSIVHDACKVSHDLWYLALCVVNHGIAGSVGPTVDARGYLFGLENSASKLSQSGILDTKGRPRRDIGRSWRVNKQLTHWLHKLYFPIGLGHCFDELHVWIERFILFKSFLLFYMLREPITEAQANTWTDSGYVGSLDNSIHTRGLQLAPWSNAIYKLH